MLRILASLVLPLPSTLRRGFPWSRPWCIGIWWVWEGEATHLSKHPLRQSSMYEGQALVNKCSIPCLYFVCIPEGSGGISFPLSSLSEFSLLPYVTLPAFSFLLPEITSHINYLISGFALGDPNWSRRVFDLTQWYKLQQSHLPQNNCVRSGVRTEILTLAVPMFCDSKPYHSIKST